MAEVSELQTAIDEAINDLEKSYQEAVKTVKTLKNGINQLERAGNEKSPVESDAHLRELNSAIERLDGFIDSWVLKSADAWNKYRVLEKRFMTVQVSELARVNDLKNLCKQSEQLAKDLLCYSLAHLRQARGP